MATLPVGLSLVTIQVSRMNAGGKVCSKQGQQSRFTLQLSHLPSFELHLAQRGRAIRAVKPGVTRGQPSRTTSDKLNSLLSAGRKMR